MANRVSKYELVKSRSLLEKVRKALEREHAAEQKAIEMVRERFERSCDDYDKDGGVGDGPDYDPTVIARFMHTWTPPREIDGELRQEALWELARLSKVVDSILRTNTISLYETRIPPSVHGSMGDIRQFEITLDPVE